MDRLTRYVALAVALVGFCLPQFASAESPHVDLVGPIGIYHADELIPVDVRITSAGLTINAADLVLTYASDKLRVDSVQREQSVFNLWPEAPSWDQAAGTVRLIGGRTNGLVAIDATIATVYFRVSSPGTYDVGLDATRSGLYLNDGQGTKVDVPAAAVQLHPRDPLVTGIIITSSTHPNPDRWYAGNDVTVTWDAVRDTQYSYTFTQDSQSVPDHVPETAVGTRTYTTVQDGRHYFTIRQAIGNGEWSEPNQFRVMVDTTPPEPFTLIHPDPADVLGRQLLSWTAEDRVSGIGAAQVTVGGRNLGVVQSPLELKPSWRGSTVTITVTDQAGNTRSASWKYPGRTTTPWWIGGIVSLIIVATGVAVIVWRRRTTRGT